MIPEALALGPVVLSVRPLLLVASIAGGLLVTWLLIGREREVARREVADSVTASVLIALGGWKLTALVLQFDVVRMEPILLLHASGGRLGIVVGAALALGYLIVRYARAGRVDDRPSPRELVPLLAVSAAAGLVVYVALFSVTAIVHAAGGGAGHAARVGYQAPEFDLAELSPTGTGVAGPVSTRDLLGAPVVVNFWATWCGPCGAEIADKNRLAREFDGRAAILGVNLTNTERGIGHVAEYARERGISYPILLDRDGSTAARYGVRGTPTTVIIAADGSVHSRIFGVLSYDRVASALRAMLDERASIR